MATRKGTRWHTCAVKAGYKGGVPIEREEKAGGQRDTPGAALVGAPRDEQGQYIPLFDRSYDEALADYEYAVRLWEEGRHPSQIEWPAQTEGMSYDEWESGPPDPRFYRRESWTEDDATTWVLYESVTEGTPLSPKFESLKGLLQWMLRNSYSQDEIGEIKVSGILPTLRAYKLSEG